MILTRWDGTLYWDGKPSSERYTILSGPAALYSFVVPVGVDPQEGARLIENKVKRVAAQAWEVVAI